MPGQRIPPLVAGVVARFSAAVRERFGGRVLAVRLFGSYARGGADEESDVDVFVLLDEVSWDERRQILELAGDLWRESDLPISPLVMDRAQYELWRQQERPLVTDIDQEGVSL